jgi:hypothetical protein
LHYSGPCRAALAMRVLEASTLHDLSGSDSGAEPVRCSACGQRARAPVLHCGAGTPRAMMFLESREQGTGQISGRPLFAVKLAGNSPSFPKVACQPGKRRSTRGKLLPFKRPSSARRHATTSPSARISPAKRRFLPRPPTAFHVQCQSPDHHPHR